MRAQPMRHPWIVLLAWCAGLCALASVLVGLNVLMLGYAESEREQDHRTWLAKANTALEAGDFTVARDEIIMARHLAPGHPDPLISEGHLHYRLKKWGYALEAYQMAIQHGSKDAGIRQNIVWAYIELGQFRKAAQVGRQYHEEGLIGGQLLRYISEAHLRMDSPKGAIPYLKAALEMEPNALFLLDKLERCYRQTGQQEQADTVKEHIEELQSELSTTSTTLP